MFKREIIQIVGGANNRWGQTFVQDNLFVVLEIEGIEKAAEIGRRIIDKLEEEYSRLEEKNLQSIKKLLSQLKLENNLSLIIGVVHDATLYLVGRGEGEVILKRGRNWGKILIGNSSSSGFLSSDDVVIFSSPSLKRLILKETMQKLLNEYSWKDAQERLASLVQGAEENQGAAGLLLRVFKKEGEESGKKIPALFEKIKQRAKFLRRLVPLRFREKEKIERKRRLTASIALILSVLLIGSLVFGNFQKEKVKQKEELKRVKEKVLPQIQEGEALLELNILQSRRKLKEAKNYLEESLPKFKKDSKEREEVQKLLEEVNQLLFSSQKSFTLSSVPLFFDLSWIKEGASGSSFSLYKKTLLILDRKTGSLYQLSLETKKSQVLGGGERLAKATKIAVYGEQAFLLLTEEEPKIVNPKLTIIIESNEEWGEILDLTAYAGNLYLLDKKGAIWKYPQREAGFAPRQNYLARDMKPDFSQAQSMNIDGAIWILNQGKIMKFVQGVPENFSLQGLEEDLKEPVDLFTNEESENIYLLDKEGKIVVFDKEGRYQAQYSWDKLSQTSDFVVSEKLGKILLLLEDKIYAIEIK